MIQERFSISYMITAAWETVIEWGVGIIIAVAGFILWLVKIIWNLLVANWNRKHDLANDRLDKLEKDVHAIKTVIYFTDLKEGKQTNIQRYMVHEFSNLENTIEGMDNNIDDIDGSIKDINKKLETLLTRDAKSNH